MMNAKLPPPEYEVARAADMKMEAIPKQEDLIRPFEWLTSPQSIKPLILNVLAAESNVQRNALHVGCGSSTLGELLVDLDYALVVDVDKDRETLELRQKRWISLNQDVERVKRLEFCVHDFCKDELPYPPQSFHLVLDKSTLDCTLCSDQATAHLLNQVYQSLAVGGVYLLISFHALDFILPMLENMPNASWKITCTTLQRQMEDIVGGTAASFETHFSNDPSKLLNVLIARKQGPHAALDHDTLVRHIHTTNDLWFQEHHPLVTGARIEQLQAAFCDQEMPLEQAYATVLFTDAEREHLDYDGFLEDWQAFLFQKPTLPSDRISYPTAVAFLQEMQ
jgi:SAM-dependent methyltransferase